MVGGSVYETNDAIVLFRVVVRKLQDVPEVNSLDDELYDLKRENKTTKVSKY